MRSGTLSLIKAYLIFSRSKALPGADGREIVEELTVLGPTDI
jgi:hypothetical protein